MHATTTQNNNITAQEFAVQVQRLVTYAARQRPELAERLARAARLATQPNQPVVFWADGTATVRSQRGGDVTYRVDGPRCECPDHIHRQRLCVHSLAAGLVRRATKECRDEAQRRKDFGRTYEAPGTPFGATACGRCGMGDILDALGTCRECRQERAAQPPVRLAIVQAARQTRQQGA